jgi:7-keto-8-aminopelargonate synthetase-like enzyme
MSKAYMNDNMQRPGGAGRLNLQALARPGVLTQNLARFFHMSGRDLPGRTQRLLRYVMDRMEAGVWQYRVRILSENGKHLTVESGEGNRFQGIDFTRYDYLGLTKHPAIRAAAHEAIDRFGVHSCSSGPLMGNSPASEQLRDATAEFLGIPYVLLFPSGWSASFGAITSIVRKGDYVVMDELAHQSLQQGAYAATDNVRKFPHLDNTGAEAVLREIRAEAPDAGILLVTEGLYSMDGDTPDLAALVKICRAYEASICVDVSHDLGGSGPGGTGSLGSAGVLDEVDMVCGGFSKVFGTPGGFLATKHVGFFCHAGCFAGSYTYAAAMSPVAASIAHAAMKILRGPEGDELRGKLATVGARAHQICAASGLTTFGTGAAIVPILIGPESVARVAGALAFERGVLSMVLEFPVVKQHQARFRLSMSVNHTEQDIQQAAPVLVSAIADARRIVGEIRGEKNA